MLADSDLDAILEYMAMKLCNQKAAADFAFEVEKHYFLLVEHPEMFMLSQNLRLCGKGYRKVAIDSFIMLYRIA